MGGVPTLVLFLRFGVTTVPPQNRVDQWKGYCPLTVTLEGSVPSQAQINQQAADNAIRTCAIVPALPALRIS